MAIPLPWGYEPPFTWSLEWATDVLKMEDGTEQRIQVLRDPRERVQVTFRIDHLAFRELRAALFTAPADTYQVPLRWEGRAVAAAITGTSAVIESSHADWVAVDQAVLVENAAGDSYATTIDGVSGHPGTATLTLADAPPMGLSFPAGTTMVIPMLGVLLEDNQPLGAYQQDIDLDGLADWQITGLAAGFRATWGTGATLTTHDGIVVLNLRPVTDGLAQEQVAAGIERLDFGTVTATAWGRAVADIRREHLFFVQGNAERAWLLKLLYTLKGRQKPFLMPTWRTDLVLSQQPNGTTAIQIYGPPNVEGVDYVADWWPSVAHRRLQFEFSDGTVAYRTVTAAVDNGGVQDLTLATTLSNPGGATTVRVSFLETCRLDEDRADVVFENANAARVSLSMRTVQQTSDDAGADFDDNERSLSSSAPVELYAFTLGSTVSRYTSWHSTVTYDSNDYEPLPMLRSALVGRSFGEGETSELEIQLPAATAFVVERLVGLPIMDASATVYRLQQASGEVKTWWLGKIAGITIDGDIASLRVPSLIADALATEIPGVACQQLCNHRLYDARCGLDASDFDQIVTVNSVDGRTVELVAVFAPDQWLRGGEAVDANGERRVILSQDGTTLLLNAPFLGLQATDELTVYVGCDHTVSTCQDKFDNVTNFGGHPHIPQSDVYRWFRGVLGLKETT